MRLYRTVFEILWLIFQKKLKSSLDSRLGLAMINMHIKFEVKSFHRYLKGTKSLKLVTWRGNAHLRDVLSSVGWDLLCWTHVLSSKCLRLPAT